MPTVTSSIDVGAAAGVVVLSISSVISHFPL
jgi:hypothetical protein